VSHKYKLRQAVRLRRMGYSDPRLVAGAGGTYEVVRLMPPDQTGEPSYRIRSGQLERAVREGEIDLA
jgi:hypothetical protein